MKDLSSSVESLIVICPILSRNPNVLVHLGILDKEEGDDDEFECRREKIRG